MTEIIHSTSTDFLVLMLSYFDISPLISQFTTELSIITEWIEVKMSHNVLSALLTLSFSKN